MSRRILCVGLVLMTPVLVAAGIMGSDLFLISVGRGPGANDSSWYTKVWIHNPSDNDARVTVSLLRRGQPNMSPEQQILAVRPGETLTIGDVLWDLFGEEEASGALRFEADRRIVVSSRIFNLPGIDPADSQGQFMAGMPADLAVGFGAATDIPGITQPADDSFRCNFALVETSGNQAEIQVMLMDGDGVEVASRIYTLRPGEPIQKNLSHLGSSAIADGGRLHIEVINGTGRVLALASMVGNGSISQDPSTLEMEVEIPTGGSSGDITAVLSGEGLTGGGSSGDVTLGIDTTGAGAGQTLVYDGAHVSWGTPSGELSLPYSGSQTTAGAAFKIINTSASGNAFGVRGENQSTAGAGVYGWSSANSGSTGGVVGQTSSPAGTGVFGFADSDSGLAVGVMGTTLSPAGGGVAAFGADDGADLIVGGTGSVEEADDGVIASDPRYGSSDLRLSSNHAVQIVLDVNNDEEDESLAVVGNETEPLFEVDAEGSLRQPVETHGLLKAAARIICGGTSPGVNSSWSAYGTFPTVEASARLGSCEIDFGFPFSSLNFIGWARHGTGGSFHVTCDRYSHHENSQILCTVYGDDGQPVDGSWSIKLLVF